MSRNPRELATLAGTWATEVEAGAVLNAGDGYALATVLRDLAADARTLADLTDRAARAEQRGTEDPPAEGMAYAVERCRCYGGEPKWAVSDGNRHALMPSDRHAKANLGRIRTKPERANVFMWHEIRRPGAR